MCRCGSSPKNSAKPSTPAPPNGSATAAATAPTGESLRKTSTTETATGVPKPCQGALIASLMIGVSTVKKECL